MLSSVMNGRLTAFPHRGLCQFTHFRRTPEHGANERQPFRPDCFRKPLEAASRRSCSAFANSMRTKLALLTFVMSTVLAFSAEQSPDLTGAAASLELTVDTEYPRR